MSADQWAFNACLHHLLWIKQWICFLHIRATLRTFWEQHKVSGELAFVVSWGDPDEDRCSQSFCKWNFLCCLWKEKHYFSDSENWKAYWFLVCAETAADEFHLSVWWVLWHLTTLHPPEVTYGSSHCNLILHWSCVPAGNVVHLWDHQSWAGLPKIFRVVDTKVALAFTIHHQSLDHLVFF